MDYLKFCEVYEALESTTKGLEKTKILSDFLKNIEKNPEQIYLLQGKVFPDWDARELGISEQLAIKIISKATGLEDKEIVDEFRTLGDLGKVTESIFKKRKQQRALFTSKLSAEKVMKNLQKISGIEGKGTVDLKLNLVAELMHSASPIEAKYLIRTVLGDLKIGVGFGILRDAIVDFIFNPKNIEEKKKYVSLIQEAYDKSTDFAEVFQKAVEGKLKEITLSPGKPVKVMLFPKAKNVENAFNIIGKPAAFEYKYDGFRCVTGYTSLYVKDKGFLVIKEIKKGDFVLTHKGNFKKVITVNKRKIQNGEKLFEINSFYGNKFKISQGHPVLVYRKKPIWVNIENLTKKDKLLFPVPKFNQKSILKNKINLTDSSGYSKNIKINDFFFRFLGYWIGDGFTNEYHNTERVGLIFNAKTEKKLSEYYEKNIKKFFQIKKISRNIHNGAIYLYWRDKPLRLWLSEYFRKEWSGKNLPKWFVGITKRQFENFILGWIESDGHKDNEGRTSITTKERNLAMYASLLGAKFGKMIGIKKMTINKKQYYKLIIPKSKRGFSLLNKDYFLLSICSLKEIDRPYLRTNLYNLQIENDESYCTSMMSLHNCMINKEKNGDVKIFTRRLEEVTTQFPEIFQYVKNNINADTFIIDAEAVGFNFKTKKYTPFQSISQRIKRKYEIEKMAKEFPIELAVFDIIYYNGKSLIDKPFLERRKIIEKIIKEEPFKIVLSKQIITSDEKEVESFYTEALEQNQEGLMGKSLSAPYKPGARIGYAVKLKPVDKDFDLVITGAEWGTGKRAGWLTSFDVSCRNENELLEIGKVSTGLKELREEGLSFEEMTDRLKKIIIGEEGRKIRVQPKIIVTVQYQNIQKSPTYSSGFALRFPRIKALRPDRGIDDIATIEEIEKETE